MIRPARLEDLSAIQRLLDQTRVRGISYDDFTPPCLVYEREGEVVGVIHALVGQPYAVITECAVDPRFHGKGYGARLLEHLETVLRVMGVKAWAAFTGVNNPTQHMLGRLAEPTGEGLGYVRDLR